MPEPKHRSGVGKALRVKDWGLSMGPCCWLMWGRDGVGSCSASGHGAGGSRASEVAAAKAKVAKLKAKCRNTLHAAAKLMCNTELKYTCRHIAMIADGEYKEYCDNIKQLTTPRGCKDVYVGWANWSWLASLKDAISSLGDLQTLGRAGFDVAFSHVSKKNSGQLEGVLDVQDSYAQQCGQLVTCLVRERGCSMLWHSSSWPGALAKLLSNDATQADEAYMELRKAAEAWSAALNHAAESPVMKKLVARCCFASPLMKWVLAFSWASEWKHIPHQVKALCEHTFTHFCQTRVNEEANGKIRDHESRQNASKVLKHLAMWEVPMVHKLLKEYGREEVGKATAPASQPAAHTLEKLFVPGKLHQSLTAADAADLYGADELEVRRAWKDKLQRITGTQDWHSDTPASQQQLMAELHLMQVMHEGGLWASAGDAWRAHLVPAGELILHEPSGTVFFCIRSWEAAWVGWEAKLLSEGLYTYHPSCQQLVWHTLFKLADCSVLPSSWVSPLRCWALRVQARCICRRVEGDKLSVLQWQA